MAEDFLGTGWSFPVETNHQGNIDMVSAEEDIRQAIRIILGTSKGERIMRPEFGCDIHEHVYDTVTPGTLNVIETSVREALIRWEPRIDVETVDVYTADGSPNKLLIEIEYRVRTTNSLSNMVYPFYMTEGEG